MYLSSSAIRNCHRRRPDTFFDFAFT
ncbi:hypothetical protein LINPERPRIM_LOCUS25213 [Linum perenne]